LADRTGRSPPTELNAADEHRAPSESIGETNAAARTQISPPTAQAVLQRFDTMIPLERVAPYLWRIPPDARPGMRVPGLVVADEALIANVRREASLEQLANGATLPGIVKAALAMPDIHQGYGLPVGGVVATDADRGVVSPGAIGFDINCGVRLLATGLDASD